MQYFKLISFVLLSTLLSCENEHSKPASGNHKDGVVSIEEFSTLMKSAHQLIDVRTMEEVGEGYIPNAVNINYRDESFKSRIITLDKSKPVLVYCQSGGRSGKAYRFLKEKGYEKVYDLKGGFKAWAAADKPISK